MTPDAEIGDVFVAELTDVITTLLGECSEIRERQRRAPRLEAEVFAKIPPLKCGMLAQLERKI
jgi:hypothetical protein